MAALLEGPTRVGGITLLAFPPSALGIYAPAVDGGLEPVGPTEILARSGAAAALNGPMYHNCGGQHLPPTDDAAYAASRCMRSEYALYDAATGVAVQGRSAGGITLGVNASGQAFAVRGATVPPGARVAVQLYPPLLLDGQDVTTPTLNTGGEWRSGLAILADGRMAFAVGSMSMTAFARALRAAGAVHAGYTDGSYSTALLVGGQRIGPPPPPGFPTGRRVASWLTVGAAGGGSGRDALGLLALAAAAGGAWYLWSRRGRR